MLNDLETLCVTVRVAMIVIVIEIRTMHMLVFRPLEVDSFRDKLL